MKYSQQYSPKWLYLLPLIVGLYFFLLSAIIAIYSDFQEPVIPFFILSIIFTTISFVAYVIPMPSQLIEQVVDKFCRYCGSEVPSGSEFCEKCGKRQ